MTDFARTKLSDFIQAGMRKHGWSGLDVCTMLGGVPKSVGSKIVNGKQTPSLMQLLVISQMFSVEPGDVVKMRLFEESCDKASSLRLSENQLKLVDIFKHVPVSQMISHNWVGIHDRNDCDEMVRVFEPYLEDVKKTTGLLRKTHAEDTELSAVQKAWVLRVRSLARKAAHVNPFNPDNFANAINDLRQVMNRRESFVHVQSILGALGVRLVLVECKGSKIDGVCTWLDDETPVIGLTLRFDRVDNFWFVLRHELRHVEQGPGKQPLIDCDVGQPSVDEQEADANSTAAEFCAKTDLVRQYLESSNGRITDEGVKEFAEQAGLNPSVFAGRVRHHLGKYNILGKLLPSYRNDLLNAVLMKDGWGYVAG